MKAVLIPPGGWESTALLSTMHLALAQEWRREYIQFYSNLPKGHFLILDNGAAEGQLVTSSELVTKATLLGADEVVLPDVMYDGEKTLDSVRTFLNKEEQYLPDGIRFMVVPQGRTRQEVYGCLDALVGRYGTERFTYGIPRHLLQTFDSIHARMDLLDHIQDEYGDITVHLLGTNPVWPQEILAVAQDHPWVRSVDTSMPYNFAIVGRRLTEWALGSVGRLPKYFACEWAIERTLLDENINTYMSWANGTEGTRS